METLMLGLLAETSIHPGSGRGLGVVDLPVAREAATDYPVLASSGLKGALRDKARSDSEIDRGSSFGKQDAAGELLISDGRLLLLPVRSLTTSYRWVTCPHLIERYSRDLARAGLRFDVPGTSVGRRSVLSTPASGKDALFLEERQFSISGEPSAELVKVLGQAILHEETRERLGTQLAVLHDDDFAWFARYGLSISARNVLDETTKQSKNLWYEETLPPDTVMYTLIAGRNGRGLGVVDQLFSDGNSYLQVGGNETVGQGWFAVKVIHAGRAGNP